MPETNVFKVLNSVDVSEFLKLKSKFKYLPWSTAWGLVMELYPDAVYEVVKSDNGCIYHTDGKTCWVETSVTIDGITRNETLPVLNHSNQPIKAAEVTSFNAGNSIKRCLVKNLALFGLGLSLWNGEELSDNAKITKAKTSTKLSELQGEIVSTCKAMVEEGKDRDEIYKLIGAFNNGNKNPLSIKSIDVAEAILSALNEGNNSEE